jgi:ribonuclease BN (tRNA processing enzyme)
VGEHLFLLDAGTGIRELGRQLGQEFPSPGLTAHLFLTHYHWDHVQGLPFFEPLYFAGNTLHLYGPKPQLEGPGSFPGVLQVLFRAPFFPVNSRELSASYPLKELESGSQFSVEKTRVRTCSLRHPQGALAYRFDHGGTSLVYATDHEPGDKDRDRDLSEFVRGADVLIIDAQYLPEELAGEKKGWGHGSWRAATEFARTGKVKNLILFHHEPVRSDREIDYLMAQARKMFPRTWAASEGLLLEVTRQGMSVGSRANRMGQRHAVGWPASIEVNQNGHMIREPVKLESLSFHGAYFLSPRSFEVQQPVEIALPVPLAHTSRVSEPGREEVRLQGYVVRTDPQTTNGGWVGVAVLFPGPVPSGQKTDSSVPSLAAPGEGTPPRSPSSQS